ncbi:MAG: glycogen-binding domain-containing protein [Candidatus Omnitrophica bacterium]|nr:glycogen-binding domain-containing protein [Candidatus Omnitrophota bacterium]
MARAVRAKPTVFTLYAPQAKRVSLAGSFNNWDTNSISAKKDYKGNWKTKISLKPGRYEYKFFVDGNWVTDPARQTVYNAFGSQNNVIEVK